MDKAAKRNVWADPLTAKARIAGLEAENANLKEERDMWEGKHNQRFEAWCHKHSRVCELESHLAMLEKALQEIADGGQGDLYSMKVANAALEGKQE